MRQRLYDFTRCLQCSPHSNRHLHGEARNPTIDLIHDICKLCTHQRTDGIKAMSRAFSWGKQVIKVVYHLQKVSGKSGWKGNGARLFGSLQRKTSGSNGTSEKVVLFFRTECSNQKFVFRFVDTQFQAFFR